MGNRYLSGIHFQRPRVFYTITIEPYLNSLTPPEVELRFYIPFNYHQFHPFRVRF